MNTFYEHMRAIFGFITSSSRGTGYTTSQVFLLATKESAILIVKNEQSKRHALELLARDIPCFALPFEDIKRRIYTMTGSTSKWCGLHNKIVLFDNDILLDMLAKIPTPNEQQLLMHVETLQKKIDDLNKIINHYEKRLKAEQEFSANVQDKLYLYRTMTFFKRIVFLFKPHKINFEIMRKVDDGQPTT